MNKTVYILAVSFPDPEAGDDATYEQVVSSHGTMDSAIDAAELYATPYQIYVVHHYE